MDDMKIRSQEKKFWIVTDWCDHSGHSNWLFQDKKSAGFYRGLDYVPFHTFGLLCKQLQKSSAVIELSYRLRKWFTL